MVNLYQEFQTEAVLREIGVDIITETGNDFLCLCPYHGNKYTPSFNVGKTNGQFICFNPSCAVTGQLDQLVKDMTKSTTFAALRLIAKHKKASASQFKNLLIGSLDQGDAFVEYPQEVIDRLATAFWEYPDAYDYMAGRGFEEDTLRHFEVGYSAKRDMITVPMHDPKGMPVGLIGRTVKDKQFRNSPNLPKKETIWNLHRAREYSTLILVEASFDGMRVHQSGSPNVGAVLGGSLSQWHIHLIDKYFTKIIIMTDFDNTDDHIYENCLKCKKLQRKKCPGHNPGRDLGMSLVEALPRKSIYWAAYDDRIVYPDGAKDADDMEDDQIQQCIKNAVSTLEYKSWGLYYRSDLC